MVEERRNAGEASVGLIRVNIAGLEIEIDASQANFPLAVPARYKKFCVPMDKRQPNGIKINGVINTNTTNNLFLQVQTQGLSTEVSHAQALLKTVNVELFLDNKRRYVFIAPRLFPPRSISVDTTFSKGVVTGEFNGTPNSPVFPIQGLDMHLVSNWLANTGEFILHASSIIWDGKGYCFAGSSGVGKSTLAHQLAALNDIEILSEDQVIIRWLDGRYWIYGTPWHENPSMCSPLGVPLSKIFFLERDGKQRTLKLSELEGTARMLQNAFIPFYRTDALPSILNHLSALSERVPFYLLDYHMGTDVWDLIQKAGVI